MNATSPWLWNTSAQLNSPDLQSVYEQQARAYSFKVYVTGDSCWLAACWPKGARIAFRLAYSPNDPLEIKSIKQTSAQLRCGGVQGSGTINDPVASGAGRGWQESVIADAQKYARTTKQNFKRYVMDCKAGRYGS